MRTITTWTGIFAALFICIGLFYLMVVPVSNESTVKGLAYAISGVLLIPVWIALYSRAYKLRKDGHRQERKGFTIDDINRFKKTRRMFAGYGMSACCNVPIIEGRCTACANPDPYYEQD